MNQTLLDAVDPLAVMLAPAEVPTRTPLRVHSGPRQTKAEKKAGKRARQQAKAAEVLELALIRQQIRDVLLRADQFEWTLQGFGMLRLYLSDAVRLHVWSEEDRVPNVSDVHTHPWAFESYVVNGGLTNTRYAERAGGELVLRQRIVPGIGLQKLEAPVRAPLAKLDTFTYRPGGRYSQLPEVIHRTDFTPGTVTLVRRERQGPDEAFVYYPLGEDFVSAEPRKATPEEVARIVGVALANWSDQ
ncbi:hypothetical protein BJP27_24540 (plasmid) [Pseudomonas oryzihabitans]|nr:hypothetical protein BJP27_23890 [Pseudomonas psychrotolerans]APQ14740.1 hypothetical protein BJP27_24540 [Pseudomonas psychrotolerans]